MKHFPLAIVHVPMRYLIAPIPTMLYAIVTMVLLHSIFPVFVWLAPPYTHIGSLLVLFGTVMVLSAGRQFRHMNTTVNPFGSATRLAMHGLYGISRNPMYVGMVMNLVGVAINLGSVMPLLMVPLYMRYLLLRHILPEEQVLSSRFGKDYLDYKKRVRRWL